MTLRGLRGLTAALLALAAVLFTIGTLIERSGHTETAAQHAAETAPALSPTPSPPGPSAGAARATPAPSRALPSSTRDPGLSAPEGSKEREAAERRKRAAAAHPKPPPATAATSASATANTPTPSTATPDASASEGSAAREAAEAAKPTAAQGHSESSERLFGVNTESTPVIVAADLVALVLIGLVLWLTGTALRLTGLTVAATSLGAVALDVRETLHQHDLGRTGLVVLVTVVATVHLAAAVAGASLARRPGALRSIPPGAASAARQPT